ncbi:MAG: hypothetical protein KIY10_02375 [Thermoplasmata archaeon]|nr:hypothetical protein [Candidatus Sysuiplasma jiujiangense]MBX8640058.1 hypothetical protein [Candidatus Sysuiplasma jiujiangense]MBX8641403.1 hypothetical protein [Candidatus Sysuiplasma jiujiangense]
MKTRVYRLSVTFEAPRTFVYDWCTDYREDDAKLIGATWTRHIFEKTKSTVVWIAHYNTGGRSTEGIRIVSLKPKSSWHLVDYDDGVNEIGDYTLSEDGRNRTVLNMVFRETFKTGEPEPASTFEARVGAMWAKYRAALEMDYAVSKRNRRKKQ